MKKYLVLRTNHGFQGRMWYQDAIVEFDDDVVPPHHFQLMDGKAEAKAAVEKREEEKTALSKMARQAIKPQPTAGEVLKNQKKVKAGDDF